MAKMTRREFFQEAGKYTAAALLGPEIFNFLESITPSEELRIYIGQQTKFPDLTAGLTISEKSLMRVRFPNKRSHQEIREPLNWKLSTEVIKTPPEFINGWRAVLPGTRTEIVTGGTVIRYANKDISKLRLPSNTDDKTFGTLATQKLFFGITPEDGLTITLQTLNDRFVPEKKDVIIDPNTIFCCIPTYARTRTQNEYQRYGGIKWNPDSTRHLGPAIGRDNTFAILTTQVIDSEVNLIMHGYLGANPGFNIDPKEYFPS